MRFCKCRQWCLVWIISAPFLVSLFFYLLYVTDVGFLKSGTHYGVTVPSTIVYLCHPTMTYCLDLTLLFLHGTRIQITINKLFLSIGDKGRFTPDEKVITVQFT